jgi:hypothetical protein
MASESEIISLLAKHKARGTIIDTNLFLLLIVGTYDLRSIGRRRTATYTPSDFRLIAAMVDRLDRIVVTPNIMTEVDNLSRSLPDKTRLTTAIRQICGKISEVYKPSIEAISSPIYQEVGLTDTHIMTMASERFLVVTDDFPLYYRLANLNRDAININHIRTLE